MTNADVIQAHQSEWLVALAKNSVPRLASFLLTFTMLLMLSFASLAFEFHSKLIEIVENKFGDDAAERLIHWQDLTNELRLNKATLSDRDKLNKVNTFFNQARFVDDQTLWGQEDYWATPVELLAKNAGDCEDYAIAKFFTLLAIGIDENKLQISYVKALELNQAHMVLAYYETPSSEPLILDNLKADILPASQRSDLEPVYSFNGLGLWLNRFERDKAKRLGGPEVMDQWTDMLRRHGIVMLRQQSKQ